MPSNKKRQTSINESLAPRRKSSRKAGKRNVLEQMAAEDVRELASRIEGEGALSEADVQRKTEAELVDHLVDHQERTSSELAPRELSAEEKINFVPASLDVSAVAGEGGGHIIRAAGVQGNLAIEQHQSNFESKDEHDCNLSDVEEEVDVNFDAFLVTIAWTKMNKINREPKRLLEDLGHGSGRLLWQDPSQSVQFASFATRRCQKESQLESMFVDQDMASDPSMSVGGDDDGDFLSDQAINELAKENDCASSSKASELELALATCESDSESEDDSISNFNDEDAHAKATLEFETHEKTMARTGVYGATNLDIFDWWRKHHKSFPNLAVVARHHLSMPATSVESERIFSLCGLMLTAHRSALSTDTAEALALLNKLSKLDRFWKVLKHEKGTAGGSKVEKNGS
eukprot:jgi/Bigna1/74739/fgenesh1_pg.30_\